jgi:hypothetical protein
MAGKVTTNHSKYTKKKQKPLIQGMDDVGSYRDLTLFPFPDPARTRGAKTAREGMKTYEVGKVLLKEL